MSEGRPTLDLGEAPGEARSASASTRSRTARPRGSVELDRAGDERLDLLLDGSEFGDDLAELLVLVDEQGRRGEPLTLVQQVRPATGRALEEEARGLGRLEERPVERDEPRRDALLEELQLEERLGLCIELATASLDRAESVGECAREQQAAERARDHEDRHVMSDRAPAFSHRVTPSLRPRQIATAAIRARGQLACFSESRSRPTTRARRASTRGLGVER